MEQQIKDLFNKQQEILARLEVFSENIKNLFQVVKNLQIEIERLKKNK